MRRILSLAVTCGLLALVSAASAAAQSCVLPDNGSGTVDLPPDCPDGYLGALQIVDGLPPGTTLEGPANLRDFANVVRFPGGTLGGEVQQFDATLTWEVSGTGSLLGYTRSLYIPVTCEVHTTPRNPGDPVQTFAQDLFRLSGQLFGDPDFCTFQLVAGTDFGLPSPGQTTLARLPSGDFAVDSFFDVTFRIDWAGCPGSPLDGFMGSSTGTEHYHAGEPYQGASCVLPDNGTGTIDLPPECPDGYLGALQIIDGLPPGTTLEGPATLDDFAGVVRFPGGILGGEVQQFAATLTWQIFGTGDLAGYTRMLAIPVECEVHTAPRNPGDPVQNFAQELYSLWGQLFGDPDFCAFQLVAGTDFGLPSPGQTTLARLPSGDFAVDSFFDITFRIDWQGCPGSPLDGLGGTSTHTARYQAGDSGALSAAGTPRTPGYTLHANTPNPFNPQTTIAYEAPAGSGRVRLVLYDLQGRRVRTLVDEVPQAGHHEVVWDGRDASGRRVASGVYFYALQTAQGTLTRKLAVIK